MKPDHYDEAVFIASTILLVFGCGFAVGYASCRKTLLQIARIVDPTFAAKTFGYLPPAEVAAPQDNSFSGEDR